MKNYIIRCVILFLFISLLIGYVYVNLTSAHEATEQLLQQHKKMYSQLSEEHKILNEEHAALQNSLQEANANIKQYNELFADYQKSENDIIKKASYGLFKSYMDYRVLQNPESIEYQLQQQAYTDEYGIRKIDGYYCVAIGTGWGCKVGDKMLVVLSNGTSFRAIMGDTKDDSHTDAATHKVTIKPKLDGSVIEFIVDEDILKEHIEDSGTVSTINKFKGSIIGIYKL